VCLGVFGERGHRPHILRIKGPDNEPAKRAEEQWHVDGQDQPASHPGPDVEGFDRVVDVRVNRCPQLAHGDGVVEVHRTRRLNPVTSPHHSLPGSPGFPSW
jgi:hypothetical protein